jgi:hypothetical protein
LSGTLPYQNYQPLILFPTTKTPSAIRTTSSNTQKTTGIPLCTWGKSQCPKGSINVEYDDCALYNRKYDMMEKLDKSELNKLKKLVVGRAKYFKYDDKENYTPILEYIDDILSDNNNVNNSPENFNNNDFRTIVLPNRPKKQSFNYNLVKVGSSRRKTRKLKKKY